MRKIDELLQEYAASHRNEVNKIIHWICVPVIFLSIVMFLWCIPAAGFRNLIGIREPWINFATFSLLLLFLYYLKLSLPLAIGMLIFSLICLTITAYLDKILPIPVWQLGLLLFFFAWIGQFYGHGVEGKKPSFLKDLQFLLIGPAWLMQFIYRKIGLKY